MSDYNPGDYIHHPDPAGLTTCCEDNGGAAVSGVTGVYAGAGSPVGVVTPAGNAALYTQTDSTPPGLIWQYYGGQWR